jgi:tryptophan synthase alpha chain
MGKLGIYLLANYPSRETFIEAVKICDKHNVDFLEIGFPFSDPIADGDTLEKACYETLQKYNFNDTVESFKEVQSIFKGKIYIMTYTNIVYSMGIDNFAEIIGKISGIILADLPLREIGSFEKGFKKHGINVIRFLTPESREEDINRAVKSSRDFVYFVSKRGTTGGEFALDEETREKISRVKTSGKEVFVGFGIKDSTDIKLACEVADGAIIGTKAVSELGNGVESFRHYIVGLR